MLAVVTLIVTTSAIFFYLESGELDSSSRSMSPMQLQIWQDLNSARKQKLTSKTWDQIAQVHYVFHSENIKKRLGSSPLVPVNPKGKKKMIVEFFEEPGSTGYMLVRYQIIDRKSGNYEEELNRRFKVRWY